MVAPKQYFFYRKEGVLKQINLDDILFLAADNNYTRFYTINTKHPHIVRSSLDATLNRLPENRFLRIHRSYAVSGDYLDEVRRETVTFVEIPDLELPISKKYYAAFVKQVTIFDSATANAKNQQEPPKEVLPPK